MVQQYMSNLNKPTLQTEALPGRDGMVKMRGGGMGFGIEDREAVLRFLMLGTESNTYYSTAKELTVMNAKALQRALIEDGAATVNLIGEVFKSGSAPRIKPIMFAFAMASGIGLRNFPVNNDTTGKYGKGVRELTYRKVNESLGTLSHYAMFVEYAKAFGGSRKGLRNCVKRYLEQTDVDTLAYQFVKYGTRSGWSGRDLIVFSHPNSGDDSRRSILFRWVMFGIEHKGESQPNMRPVSVSELSKAGLHQIVAVDNLKSGYAEMSRNAIHQMIEDYRMTHEMIPSEIMKDKNTWDALSRKMPAMALTRTLNRMGGVGLINSKNVPAYVIDALKDHDRMIKARVHPLDIFVRLLRYSQGSDKYNNWEVNKSVVKALNDLMYALVHAQEPTGKRIMVGLDDSGSMWNPRWGSNDSIKPAEYAAALGMMYARSDPSVEIVRFSSCTNPFPINPHASYDQVRDLLMASRTPSWTDGTSPIVYATNHHTPIDTFMLITDGEFNAGIQLTNALKQHRDATGGDGKVVAIHTEASTNSVIDPQDTQHQLSMIGFDPSAFGVINQFIMN